MDELISRKAAIEAFTCNGSVFIYGADVCKAIVSRIMALPPAQTEQQWIPVENSPPKEEKHYWVCTDSGYQCECEWTNDIYGLGASDNWDWSIFDIPQYSKVVAWMPLPKPWKGEKMRTCEEMKGEVVK